MRGSLGTSTGCSYTAGKGCQNLGSLPHVLVRQFTHKTGKSIVRVTAMWTAPDLAVGALGKNSVGSPSGDGISVIFIMVRRAKAAPEFGKRR
jgi:hypothetical protein